MDDELQERFPRVRRFLDVSGQTAVSHVSPDQVGRTLEGAFC